ncbi:Alkaline phosphatase synthesis sensor protein PhoR [Roseivivax sp. THAF40]|uniref:sensor histidine kinase n=1 Tax=unclassified Roseivivax TaxID=2639302 RepID=UPI001267DED1|nr:MULTISPECIES: HAMP domain-containing sensor histidine kinase [unclassified Roseivivax]QFS83758.1 Alkaline phosphatase synthesis sensor protein PhoR [Roseivivax sp. THAF197b]QFT47560.1 Alkaline phosphatase synthesis sensor protein PhoR [Roseivivax sp. THAF40]
MTSHFRHQAAVLSSLLPRQGEDADLWSVRRRLRDYAKVGRQLFLQRIIIYSFAITLAGAYYDWGVATLFYCLVGLVEVFDGRVFLSILRTRRWSSQSNKTAMLQIYAGTVLSALAIAGFSISLAILQGPWDGHFLAHFILFSAAVFACINNRHFLGVLAVRLAIYTAAILFIPLRDIWLVRPPLSSDIWLHFFTVLFVLGFIFECARSFLVGYSQYLVGRKALEDEHERTKAAYLAKSRFLSTVSHELRTPLTSIKGSLEIVNSGMLGEPPEKFKRPLDVAVRNSRRLADLVDDLLLLQKGEAGEIDYNFDIQDFGAAVCETIEAFRPYAERKGISLISDVRAGVNWARFDSKRIDQVIVNILSNAVKFSNESGAVTISMMTKGPFVRLSIKDDGIGIPEEAREKVFEEFQQINSSSTRAHEGTGLGMTISKQIMKAHQGSIDFESKLGSGTVFSIELYEEEEPLSHAEPDSRVA